MKHFLEKNKGFLINAAILFIMVAWFTLACTGFNRMVGLEDDNAVEESLEFWLNRQTGFDVDLTPGSQE